MKNEIIDIIHFHNGKQGGVFSVIKNLLRFSVNTGIYNHIIFTINEKDRTNFILEKVDGAHTQKVFYYSSENNFYHTCRLLKKLLPDDKAVIIAHDWLELGMVSNLGLQNPVIFFLHGDYDYYYQLAIKHVDVVDLFIPTAKNIEDKLLKIFPCQAENIKYLRFQVLNAISIFNASNEINIVFVGRLELAKGYNILPKIASELRTKKIFPIWHIIGKITDENIYEWNEKDQVVFYGEVSNDVVMQKMTEMSFLVLPSIAEGMPLSIIEAMKCGVIPLVSDLTGGIQELIEDGETGFKIKIEDISAYAEKIAFLLMNESELKRMRKNCIKLSNKLFNPLFNTIEIEKNIINTTTFIKNKKAKKIYGSRLDNSFIPNFITKIFRSK